MKAQIERKIRIIENRMMGFTRKTPLREKVAAKAEIKELRDMLKGL